MARALGLPGPSAVPAGYLPGLFLPGTYWVLSWLTKYQSELEPPPGRTALTPVTWAPLGRLSRAQGDGPQEVLGVTAVAVCHTLLALRHCMLTEWGRITPYVLLPAVIHTVALVALCGFSQVAWTVPPLLAVMPSSASAN